jgi:hypothetical protein
LSISESERHLLLARLFELRSARADDELRAAEIEALAVLLGGDPDSTLFGAYRHGEGTAPLPEYPADDTDEG